VRSDPNARCKIVEILILEIVRSFVVWSLSLCRRCRRRCSLPLLVVAARCRCSLQCVRCRLPTVRFVVDVFIRLWVQLCELLSC